MPAVPFSRVALPDEREPHERQDRHSLKDAERQERAVQPQLHHHGAPEKRPGDGRGNADRLVHPAHVVQRKPGPAQEERGRQRLGEGVPELVQHEEHEEGDCPGPGEELAEGLDNRFAQGARRRGSRGRLLAPKRGDHPDRHQRRHDEVGVAPAQGRNRARSSNEDERKRARDERRDAVARDADRTCDAALLACHHVGAVGVDDDVLRGRGEGDDEREPGDEREIGARRLERHGGDSQDKRELGEDEPAAAPPEKRRHEAVHRRRPEELPDIRNAHQRERADRRQVHALDRHPGLQRAAGERERQSRGEAEREDHREASAPEDFDVGRGHQSFAS
jgi:hypothetical protein